MQKFILFLLFFILLTAGFFVFKYFRKPQVTTSQTLTKKLVDQGTSPAESYMFIPYWTIDSNIASIPYDKLIYFGIAADKNGIITADAGFQQLENFVQNSENKRKLLTLRMLNTDTNLEILNSSNSQKKIIDEAIILAKKYKFEGIVLDLETQGLPFEKLVTNITKFNAFFAKEVHNKKLSFGTLLYGDTFYRIRPYDVSSISKIADRVYVMAYDFSKARGNPGPNFPLGGVDLYGYDFKTMVFDFLKTVPREKLTIIFGMFGYDWKIDSDGRSRGLATSKTTLQFEKKATLCLDNDSCKRDIDKNAQETKIEFHDLDEKHIIWFENNTSMQKKTNYLHSKNLNSVGYWAYGYF